MRHTRRNWTRRHRRTWNSGAPLVSRRQRLTRARECVSEACGNSRYSPLELTRWLAVLRSGVGAAAQAQEGPAAPTT